jgi:hypothetical protein
LASGYIPGQDYGRRQRATMVKIEGDKLLIKKIKLSKKQAQKYGETSGFPNTGKVELHIVDDKTWEETMGKFYEPKTPSTQ